MKKYFKVAMRFLIWQKTNTVITIAGVVLATLLLISGGNVIYSNQLEKFNMIIDRMGRYQYRFKNLSDKKINILKKHAKVKSCYIVKNVGYIQYNYKKVMVDIMEESTLKKVFSFDVLKGRYPTNKDEIAVSSRVLPDLLRGYNVGDKVRLKINTIKGVIDKDFIIVGIVDEKLYRDNDGTIYGTIFTKDDETISLYDAYTEIYDDRDFKSICNNIDIKYMDNIGWGIGDREECFTMHPYSKSLRVRLTEDDNTIALIIFISVLSIIFIINSFNVSIDERKRSMMLAKSVGASPSQIFMALFCEGIIICVIGISLGIVVSFIFSGFVLYWEVIIKTIPILIITISLSISLVFIKIAYRKPIEGIVIEYEDILKHEITRAGIERKIAIRNLKLSNKKKSKVIVPLSIAMIMFILLYCNYANNLEEYLDYGNNKWDIQYFDNTCKVNEEELDNIKSINGIQDVCKNNYSIGYLFAVNYESDNKYITENNNEFKYKGYIGFKTKIIDGEKELLNEYNKYLVDKNGELNKLKDGEVALVKTKFIDEKFGGQPVKYNSFFIPNNKELLNYNGDKVPKKLTEVIDKKSFSVFKISKLVSKDIMKNKFLEQEYDVVVIMTHNDYTKFVDSNSYNSFYIHVKDGYIDEVINKLSELNSGSYKKVYNISEQREKMKRAINDKIVHQYEFAIVMSIISLLNVINWVIANVVTRKREILLYRSMGMGFDQIVKIIVWEASIISSIACLIGVILGGGFTITYPIRLLFQGKFYIKGWCATIVGCSFIIMVLTIVGTLISLKIIKKNLKNGSRFIDERR